MFETVSIVTTNLTVSFAGIETARESKVNELELLI
jgi:hypothetical protein